MQKSNSVSVWTATDSDQIWSSFQARRSYLIMRFLSRPLHYNLLYVFHLWDELKLSGGTWRLKLVQFVDSKLQVDYSELSNLNLTFKIQTLYGPQINWKITPVVRVSGRLPWLWLVWSYSDIFNCPRAALLMKPAFWLWKREVCLVWNGTLSLMLKQAVLQ